MRGKRGVGTMVGVVGVIFLSFVSSASAYRFSSTSYVIDASVANSFGGTQGSSNYKLTGSGGESVIGNGAGGSYKVGMGYVAQLDKSLSLALQPSGLIGYYPLDEGSGTAAYDNSANTNNATLVSSPTWSTGKIGQALTFSGAGTQYGDLGNPSAYQATSLTIAGWVKTSTTPPATGSVLIGKYGAWSMGIAPTASGIFDYGTLSNACTDTTILSDGQWHYLAASIQNGVANGTKYYVDGAYKSSCTVTSTSQANAVTIGGNNPAQSNANGLNGSIDQIKLYDHVLSAQDIAAEYTAQVAGNTSGVSLGNVIAGVSNSALLDAVVRTDANGYTLAVNQDTNLTSGANTIPAVSGSIASPVAWTEGSTKGLGFSLSATNATALPAGWGSGANFAAFPAAAATFYTRTGQQSSADYVRMKLRLDVAAAQAASATPYTNVITVTGTMTP